MGFFLIENCFRYFMVYCTRCGRSKDVFVIFLITGEFHRFAEFLTK